MVALGASSKRKMTVMSLSVGKYMMLPTYQDDPEFQVKDHYTQQSPQEDTVSTTTTTTT